jgi:hypothetical protein
MASLREEVQRVVSLGEAIIAKSGRKKRSNFQPVATIGQFAKPAQTDSIK